MVSINTIALCMVVQADIALGAPSKFQKSFDAY